MIRDQFFGIRNFHSKGYTLFEFYFIFVNQIFKSLPTPKYMLIIILILITGVLLGLSIRKISAVFNLNEWILTLTIYLIIFMIAIPAGVDDLIVKDIDSIGLFAFSLIVLAAIGVTVIYRILYVVLFRRAVKNKLQAVRNDK